MRTASLIRALGLLGMLANSAAVHCACSSTCDDPSATQAQALFSRIEQRYVSLFSQPQGEVAQTLIGSQLANFRYYGNQVSMTGLATYQGGLWYYAGGTWRRYSSLDEANAQFCGGLCWSASNYPVVDTGQSRTYNATEAITAPSTGQAFYGQDAQFSGIQPSYQLSTDGKTVSDRITRLTWMRGPNTTLAKPETSDKKNWAAAQAWVATVNAAAYGGFTDWRLPTIKELYSLMDFRGTDPSSYTGTDVAVLTPFIDTRYFNFGYGQTSQGERIIDSQYASSTLFVANPGDTVSAKLFGLNLADGRIKGYDLTTPGGGVKTFFVQLVRGAAGYGVNAFTDNGNDTITDSTTGLMWARNDNGTGMTWQEALAWVQSRNAARHLGYSDWRMPNAKELQSIVDYTNAPDYNGKPAIDTRFFNVTSITNENGESDFPYFWTSTTHAGYSPSGSAGSHAVYIPFGRALGWPDRSTRWVDVHGAGCQRSDPKSGPPYPYATTHSMSRNGITYTGYAFGPQGDALRGLNFVRLVRSVP